MQAIQKGMDQGAKVMPVISTTAKPL